MPNRLASRRVWVFDLDNTLYPPEIRLFDQIEARMTAYVMEALGLDRTEADRLRRNYWAEYGTTLSGLMTEHGLDPAPYLAAVHDISLDALDADPELRAAILALPGRRIVHTNGCAAYAARVLEARGLAGVFDAVYGIAETGFEPKPVAAAFAAVIAADGIVPAAAVMFEDDIRNLAVPHALGMATVHVAAEPSAADHVHHHTADLRTFLACASS
ncbi:MAG: pyrimidine 5'-nucleotidase [Rhodobacteraceae bacterium]|nr:pyrimidine 5'-nucleotidase [Paracoccaceae bacterium]